MKTETKRDRARRDPGICSKSRVLQISIANERSLSQGVFTRHSQVLLQKRSLSLLLHHISTRKQLSVDEHRSANNILANATAEGFALLCAAKRPSKLLGNKLVLNMREWVCCRCNPESVCGYVRREIAKKKQSQSSREKMKDITVTAAARFLWLLSEK